MMEKDSKPVYRLSQDSQKLVINYSKGVLQAWAHFEELHTKMRKIDEAYARYVSTGCEEAGNEECGAIETEVVTPVVISQVDSYVGYLADVFLSGYPLFPIVSTPAKRKMAEQLEALIDDHALLGGYARQLLMFLRNGVKYNISAIEADWDSIEQFSVADDYFAKDSNGQRINRDQKFFTKLKNLDMYNTFWDTTVLPGDISSEGDYAGYVEILSRTKLKRLITKLGKNKELINAKEAMDSLLGSSSPTGVSDNYTLHPTVSQYITSRKPTDQVDWSWYLSDRKDKKGQQRVLGTGSYEKIVLYARIQPADFGIDSPQPNTPQIWKFIIINGDVLLSAKRIISAYDYLPILFGQPLEDGLGYQTQSVGENAIPIQEAATTLYAIRFNSARRAVADKAIYDADAINPNDINSKSPAAKIPFRANTLMNKDINSIYKQIPFDMRGTEAALQDASHIVSFARELSGLNNARQGMPTKGNKSVTEWNDTMGGSENRLRLPALCLEHQVFSPLKFIIMLNIYQYGENATVVSQRSGESINVDISALRKEVLSFRAADGYTPKSKMASTEILVQGMTLLMNAPILQQAYGSGLPGMFAHLMQLGGVRGLEEYAPENQQQAGQSSIPGAAAPGQAPTARQQPSVPPTQGVV